MYFKICPEAKYIPWTICLWIVFFKLIHKKTLACKLVPCYT